MTRTADDQKRITFYQSFGKVFLFLFVLGTSLGVVIGLGSIWLHSSRAEMVHILKVLPPHRLALLFVKVLLIVAVVTFVVVRAVRVSALGIESTTAFGFPRKLAWRDITRTRPFSLLGLKCVRLYDAIGKRPIWLPIFLNRSSEFAQLVKSLEPEEGLLTQYLTT